MFPRQAFFKFRPCFHIEFKKMAASAVLHFHITCPKPSTVPGIQTVLRNWAIQRIYPYGIVLFFLQKNLSEP